MPRRSLLTAALPLLLAPLLPAGCQVDGDDVDPDAPTAARAAEPTGQVVELTLASPDRATIEAIAQHLEDLGDVDKAKVQVRAHDDGTAQLRVELWGRDLPEGDALAAALRDGFDELADAVIVVTPASADGPADPTETVDDPRADPAEVERAIVQRLRDEGERGDIAVQVTDHPEGGREVDVRVGRHD
jgi:hypothetical protein